MTLCSRLTDKLFEKVSTKRTVTVRNPARRVADEPMRASPERAKCNARVVFALSGLVIAARTFPGARARRLLLNT